MLICRIAAEGPCPPHHHHRLLLSLASLLTSPMTPRKTRRGCWRCWPRVADPRYRRGVRYRLAVILALAVCAVLAGARSFTAIAEWAGDADEETLARLG